MMKLQTKNGHDWQGFSRILEIMSFVEEIEASDPEEVREAADDLCELPPTPGQTMSLEEVVFWAGIATGMELWHHAEQETLDPATAEKMLVFSSIFSHSIRNAIVDMALGQLEPDSRATWLKLRDR